MIGDWMVLVVWNSTAPPLDVRFSDAQGARDYIKILRGQKQISHMILYQQHGVFQ